MVLLHQPPSSSETSESWLRSHGNQAAMSITLLGLLARVWTASGTFLNPDEALHFRLANQASLAACLPGKSHRFPSSASDLCAVFLASIRHVGTLAALAFGACGCRFLLDVLQMVSQPQQAISPLSSDFFSSHCFRPSSYSQRKSGSTLCFWRFWPARCTFWMKHSRKSPPAGWQRSPCSSTSPCCLTTRPSCLPQRWAFMRCSRFITERPSASLDDGLGSRTTWGTGARDFSL